MPFDVFISHSLKDKATAEAVCAKLEEEKIRCWIAPRDIRPGADWAKSIVAGLKSCRVMVLVFSSHSNNSQQVGREVKLAFERGLTVMPFRIEDVKPGEDLEYYMTSVHWLDALTEPMEHHIERLALQVKAYIDATSETETATPVEPAAAYATDPDFRPATTTAHRSGSHDTPEQFQRGTDYASGIGVAKKTPAKQGKGLLVFVLALLIIAGAAAGWWIGVEQPKRDADQQQVATAEKQKQLDAAKAEAVEAEAKLKAADDEKQRQGKIDDALASAQAAVSSGKYTEAQSQYQTVLMLDATNIKAKTGLNDLDKAEQEAAMASAAEKQQQADETKKNVEITKSIAGATKENPFVNSLGMKFVPVPITGGPTDGQKVLFSIWDTRVQDYRIYANANTGVDDTWKSPAFDQGDDHPVVDVSWEDATAFCAWLTQKERKEGKIGANDEYRLPTDHEWSCAVGIGNQEDASATPASKDCKIKGVYPWGTQWPPPFGAGNYGPSLKVDDYDFTSPVGSFRANQIGLYDMGGNVYQWCEDWSDREQTFRVRRGVTWNSDVPALSSSRGIGFPGARDGGFLSSSRGIGFPGTHDGGVGFRCVLVSGPSSR